MNINPNQLNNNNNNKTYDANNTFNNRRDMTYPNYSQQSYPYVYLNPGHEIPRPDYSFQSYNNGHHYMANYNQAQNIQNFNYPHYVNHHPNANFNNRQRNSNPNFNHNPEVTKISPVFNSKRKTRSILFALV